MHPTCRKLRAAGGCSACWTMPPTKPVISACQPRKTLYPRRPCPQTILLTLLMKRCARDRITLITQ